MHQIQTHKSTVKRMEIINKQAKAYIHNGIQKSIVANLQVKQVLKHDNKILDNAITNNS